MDQPRSERLTAPMTRSLRTVAQKDTTHKVRHLCDAWVPEDHVSRSRSTDCREILMIPIRVSRELHNELA